MSSKSSPGKSCHEIEKAMNPKKGEEIVRPLCTICHDRSSGFHYGTHACEGCKGFFRRMVTNAILAQSMLQCTGTVKDTCDINSVTRNNCQRCRLQKCFQMGMTRHKTRLGRRTKASSSKMECRINSHIFIAILSDDEMSKYIKRESRYFNNNDTEDDEPLGKCIKHKAKIYSEKNSKCYQKYLNIGKKESTVSFDNTNITSLDRRTWETIFSEEGLSKGQLSKFPSDQEITRLGHDTNIFGISDFDIGDSKSMCFTQTFLSSLSPTSNETASSNSTSDGSGTERQWFPERNKPKRYYSLSNYCNKSPMFESIRLNSEKLQIDKMCMKIRVFLAYDLDHENIVLLNNYKKIMSSLHQHFFNHNSDDLDNFSRIGRNNIKSTNDSQIIFNEVKSEMIDMCHTILNFFRKLPDLDLFQGSAAENIDFQKKIIQTLAIWMLKFVNVSECILYNQKLSKKIPFDILTQSPLKHFFEILFYLADIANSIFTSEIDDTELSLISILIVTFPKKGFIHCSENMLQSDSYLKVRFIYSALLYEYLFAEKFQQNIDHTESQLQRFCWLINQSYLLQDRDVSYLFSYLKL